MTPAVLLLSGGIDSATCGAIARSQGFELYAMSFRYGQRHAVELQSAAAVARFLNVREHRIVDIDLRAFGGSALTSDEPVPKQGSGVRGQGSEDRAQRSGGSDQGLARASQDTAAVTGQPSPIPSTYVPARNTIFLSFAMGWAEIIQSSDIFIGVNAVDYSGYPDCRPEYIAAYERMANLATRAGVEGKKLTIHTPLVDLTKAAIIKTGVGLGLDYGITHSCYDPSPDGRACGGCDSCVIRRRGFAEAGVKDPTRYAQG